MATMSNSLNRSKIVDTMHANDKHAGMLLKPWVAVTPATSTEIDENKEYFCVATWATIGLWSLPKFAMLNSKVMRELHDLPKGQLVGGTAQTQFGIRDFRLETFTVWHEREHMAAFYKSGAHKNAMMSMRNELDFRARRVWVKGADLPKPGDFAATKDFVVHIKSGGFPEAGPARKTS